jgi:hypothetical protein
MLAMSSMAVTASICASTSEAALLVASFMRFSLDLGMIHRCPLRPDDPVGFTRNTPRRVFALTSPHSANIDRPKVEQQYGGNLARVQPVYARREEFWKRTGNDRRVSQKHISLIRQGRPDTDRPLETVIREKPAQG